MTLLTHVGIWIVILVCAICATLLISIAIHIGQAIIDIVFDWLERRLP